MAEHTEMTRRCTAITERVNELAAAVISATRPTRPAGSAEWLKCGPCGPCGGCGGCGGCGDGGRDGGKGGKGWKKREGATGKAARDGDGESACVVAEWAVFGVTTSRRSAIKPPATGAPSLQSMKSITYKFISHFHLLLGIVGRGEIVIWFDIFQILFLSISVHFHFQ